MTRFMLLAAALTMTTAESAMNEPAKAPEIAPARDGDIAIAEELCAARKAGTVAAYDLFIARHPGHPFVEIAKQERERLVVKDRQ